MLALSSLVFLLGVGGFLYIRASSPLALIGGSDRPIAAATLFVPSQSPFSISLLTRPEKLLAFAQSLEEPKQRQQTLQEIEQVKQQFAEKTGLDYEQTIQPWLGDEATFAAVSADLDADASNGEQPGYLAVLEIDLDRQLAAKEFLRLFWQQQALAGSAIDSEVLSGVRILSIPPASSLSDRPQSTWDIRATALAGDQFILLANDVRVLRRSIRVAQTAENLAQTSAYRQAADDLPKQRIGLAYFDFDLLNAPESHELSNNPSDKSFTTVSIGLEKTGLIANALMPEQGERESTLLEKLTPIRRSTQSLEPFQFLPANSEVAIAHHNLPQLNSALTTTALFTEASPEVLPVAAIPDLFKSVLLPSTAQTSQPDPDKSAGDWATGNYALARVGQQDWILAVERDEDGIADLDQRAIASGYSKSNITIGEATATVWTRLVARNSARQSISELETEVLGLHVQQGRYEIFTNSLAAMSNVLAIAESSSVQSESAQDVLIQPKSTEAESTLTSLAQSARFQQAIEPLATPSQGYVYLDWPTIAPALRRSFPALNQIMSAADPLFSHVDTVAATRHDQVVDCFVRLQP